MAVYGTTPLLTTEGLTPRFPKYNHRGKVRESFFVDDESMVVVATDRISVFDVVLPTAIAGKGVVLTQMSNQWLKLTESVVDNHLVTANSGDLPRPFSRRPELVGRSMLVERLKMIGVECVARGYLTGSGLRDYQQTGGVCGNKLPSGLVEASKLPSVIFTPATKETAPGRHDKNITFKEMVERISNERLARRLRDLTLALYTTAAERALGRGIIIADTKFEFGVATDGRVVLADEVLTPDSSRFWPTNTYQEGQVQPSLDKQYVRDYIKGVGWNDSQPAPGLPEEVVAVTRGKYIEAYRALMGV